MSATEPATDCDECSSEIAYGVTCYAVPTGAEDEGRKVVRIVCAACYGTPAADIQHVTAVKG